MTITVIMPVYNGERYIEEAIESIVAQTYRDWQLIVVNDGSTDATSEILTRYADPRICVIHQVNRGEAAARNAGLDIATGMYIGFLDADDLYLHTALADLSGYLDAHGDVGVVFSDGHFSDAQGRPLMRLSEHRHTVCTGDVLESLVLNPGLVAPPVCTMVRRQAIECYDIRFDERLVIGPDCDFFIQLARRVRFGYLDEVTCKYRIHETNITRTSGRQRRRSDLIEGRLKVLRAAWFEDLSLSTKVSFLSSLLVDLLCGNREQQQGILLSPRVRALPPSERACLLRRVATCCLLEVQDPEFARECLEQATSICPGDTKAKAMLTLLRIGYPVSRGGVLMWQALHRATKYVGSLGKRKLKAIPAALASLDDLDKAPADE